MYRQTRHTEVKMITVTGAWFLDYLIPTRFGKIILRKLTRKPTKFSNFMSISRLVSVSSFRLSLNRPPEPKNLKKAPNNRAFWGNKMNWGRVGSFLFLSGEGG